MEEVTNNPEVAPEIIGQGEGTGEVTETEQPEAQAQDEVESGEEGKGTPDDPKLLRAKMTQATQRAADAEKKYEELLSRSEKLLSHPKVRQALEEIRGEGVQPAGQPSLKYADMTDEQKSAYNTLKPFLSLFLEEMGVTPKLAQFENFAMTSVQREAENEHNRIISEFYAKHPEARDNPQVNKAIADIINNGLARGEIISPENAWKIYTSDSAEANAKQKVLEENRLKKEAAMPKPSGATPAPIQKGKMSPRQAVEEALKTVGY
jgi:hypothetical protein